MHVNEILFYMRFSVIIGVASETLNDWADEEAGLEAVQKILDSLDDIHALQDSYADEDILRDMLTDNRLCALLQVTVIVVLPCTVHTHIIFSLHRIKKNRVKEFFYLFVNQLYFVYCHIYFQICMRTHPHYIMINI